MFGKTRLVDAVLLVLLALQLAAGFPLLDLEQACRASFSVFIGRLRIIFGDIIELEDMDSSALVGDLRVRCEGGVVGESMLGILVDDTPVWR
jgi:hypothetical protein